MLYAKQSYTGYPSCEYPDAYVDPYPEFFARLVAMADKGIEAVSIVTKSTGQTPTALSSYLVS